MFAVKFEKVKTDHSKLRTDEVKGVTNQLPVEGEPFIVTAEGLEFGTRMVNTSPVKSIERHQPDVLLLTTESGSLYKVTVLGILDESKTTES